MAYKSAFELESWAIIFVLVVSLASAGMSGTALLVMALVFMLELAYRLWQYIAHRTRNLRGGGSF